MNSNKKAPTGSAIIDALKRSKVSLPPLSFSLVETDPLIAGKFRLDALVLGRWGQSSLTFATEIKALSTPKAFMAGIALLKAAGLPKNRPPLLITPFLSEVQLQDLEREGINGVDLCGNGVICMPPKLTVFRTGRPNLFSSSSPIKNIYRKTSSLVGRAFFCSPLFSSVKQVVEEIARRDILAPAMGLPSLTFGTASKVLSGLEQDLIIERGDKGIRLLQPDTLLEKLSRNYSSTSGSLIASVKVDRDTLFRRLESLSVELKVPIVATGLSSVSRYAVMQREDRLSVYCPRGEELVERLGTTASSRFPNLEIFGTQDAAMYFDARQDSGFFWASPLQTYLELMSGDKRDQETANQVKTFLFDAIKKEHS